MSRKVTLFRSAPNFLRGFYEELLVLFVESWIILLKTFGPSTFLSVIRVCERMAYG